MPISMFDDNGDMRIIKSKSVLKHKLQVSHSTRSSQPQVVIIDRSAILWVINWPINGNVQDLVNGYINYFMKLLNECDVYLVFMSIVQNVLQEVDVQVKRLVKKQDNPNQAFNNAEDSCQLHS